MHYLNAVSVYVHCPIQLPLKRFTEDHELLKQKHLPLAWFTSLWIRHHQCVLENKNKKLSNWGGGGGSSTK